MSHSHLLEHLLDSTEGVSSGALLALKRFCRRSLKQIGVGAIALLLMTGIATQGADAQPSSIDTLSASVAPHWQAGKAQTDPFGDFESYSSLIGASADASSELLSDRPFQVLRPKMTYHRLTTSRLSIPGETHQTIASSEDR